jgi:hypothetical protein
LRLTVGYPFARVWAGAESVGFALAPVLIPQAFVAGAGGSLGDHLVLGGEYSVGYSVHAVSEEKWDTHDRDLVLQHVGAVATWFPKNQRFAEAPGLLPAPRGPYLRLGLAVAFLYSSVDPAYAPPGAKDWKEPGLGVTGGVGWGWVLLSKALTLEVGFDLAYDRFRSSDPAAPDAALGIIFSGGLGFY